MCKLLTSRRNFILLCSTNLSHFTVPCFTPKEANFLLLMAPEGMILTANFQNFSGVTHHTSLLWRGYQSRNSLLFPPQNGAFTRWQDAGTPLLVPRPSCPLRRFGAPLVPLQEQSPGAATEPNGHCWATACRYATPVFKDEFVDVFANFAVNKFILAVDTGVLRY